MIGFLKLTLKKSSSQKEKLLETQKCSNSNLAKQIKIKR